MVDGAVTAAERIAALEAAHPGWAVWRSRQGVMWGATRRRDLSFREIERGLDQSLVCDSADELAERLGEQDARERSGAVR